MLKDLRSRALFAGGATLLFAGLAGCPSYTFLEILPERVTENQIIIEPGKPVPADILFVVDNSCSMEDEQELLARNFDAFIQLLTQANADYRIGVVTTSLKVGIGQPQEERGGVSRSSFSETEPYQLIGTPDPNACMPVGIPNACFRGPDAEQRVVASTQPPMSQITAFQNNVRVGSCGIGQEEGLAAMLAGLRKMGPGECNAGFLRDEANLVVVILSDEDDQSDQRNIDTIISALAQIKPLSRVRFAAIVGATQNEAGATATRCAKGGSTQCGGLCERYGPVQGSQMPCRNQLPACDGDEICGYEGTCVRPEFQAWQYCYWCSYYNADDCCSALRGTQYVEFARRLEAAIVREAPELTATGCRLENPENTRVGCLVDSICQESFSDTLKRIATDLVINNIVRLTPAASYPPGVVLRVNGEEWVNGVDFIVSENGEEIRYPGRAPGQGDVVEVFYTLPQ